MKLRWVLVCIVLALLLVPALALSAARLLDPAGGTWVRLVAFTPYALPLYVVALAFLLLARARGRGVWRGLATTLAIGSLAGVVLHAFLAVGPFLGSGPERDPQRDELRVMTVNLMRGHAAPTRVVELARDNQIQLLVAQEVTPAALSALQEAGLGELLPETAGEPAPGAAGTMAFSVKPTRHVQRLATDLGSYSMTIDGLRVLAVHPRPPVGDATGWAEDHTVIRRAAEAGDAPTLIVGDLNATTDHRVVRELVGRGFHDAATVSRSRWQPTWPAREQGTAATFGLPIPPLVAIDHVLADGDIEPLETETVSIDGSDHRALVAVLQR